MSSIQLTIPEELKGTLKTFDYLCTRKLIKIQFSEAYANRLIFQIFKVDSLVKSLKELERKIKDAVPKLTNSQYISLESAIYQELDQILQQQGDSEDNNSSKNITIEKVQQLRKFEHDGKLYESIIVNNQPYFITVSNNNGEEDNKDYSLVERIELANNTFLPQDTITTINPLPYKFKSEEELNQYFEKAKSETFDTLFEKVLTEFSRYLNIGKHVLTILSADIIYSYFQDKFGTTHYNIFIGENGSGKNSALLVFKYLGYRVFYVTAANAANYYTFLGDIQEGQGTIAEDEADDIDKDKDKQRILKTGYASGGTVPKIEFSKTGSRSQKPYLTFCHKWLAMEEIPDERKIRGILDRSFIFKFLAGEVQHNIKDIEQNENSDLFDKITDLRKILFVFKFIHHNDKFEDVQLNIKNRNAELTKPLLRLFKNSKALDQIRDSLSILIREKSQIKSNSTEAKILEALNSLISENCQDKKDIYQFTNEQVFDAVRQAMDGLENQWDDTYSTFITPDGLHVSKKKIKQILVSKFNATPDKINKNDKTVRVIKVSKNWLEKLGKQYEVIEGIDFVDSNPTSNTNKGFCERDTMTDVTHLESANPYFDKESNTENRPIEDDNGTNNKFQDPRDITDGNPGTAYTNNNMNEVNHLEEQGNAIHNHETNTSEDVNGDPKLNLLSNNNNNGNAEKNQVEGARMGLHSPIDEGDDNNKSSSIVDTDNSNNQTDDFPYDGLDNDDSKSMPITKLNTDNSNSFDHNFSDEFQGEEININKFHSKSIGDSAKDNTSKDNQTSKNIENMGDTLSESVTSVTSVMKNQLLPIPYICQFCPDYSSNDENDLYMHKFEKHKKELLKYSKLGGLNITEQNLVKEIKMRMKETSRVLKENDDDW